MIVNDKFKKEEKQMSRMFLIIFILIALCCVVNICKKNIVNNNIEVENLNE